MPENDLRLVLNVNIRAYRYPPCMYTDPGRRLTAQLWNETLKELRFAGVETVLQRLKK
jgi:hypothetical protein